MTMEVITLPVSAMLLERARMAAAALKRPLEDILASALDAALPDVVGAPPGLYGELAGMTWLSESELWAIAQSQMSRAEQLRLSDLSVQQTSRALTPDEEKQLEALRSEYGRITLRKARAYALLSLRSGRPLLADA